MKNIFTFIGLSAISLAAVFASNATKTTNETIEWAKTTHDFGTVKMGPKADTEFKFTNKGATPVTVKSAQPSCGCTASDYSKEPIMPGKTGYIKASYGTEGRPGFFKKSITVTFDNDVIQVLNITGTVSSDTGSGTGNEL